ncbi:hypothetical protein FHS31_000431 [Sphingomonas vulcanisoli]|uniref:Uncharacterized protein n=1 Tax=Sphingomonas vulcanisoli TaxID=1658060 RepID=A0ABX0TMU6_9SPHN|nr:XrtV sorting system accessory protein [Sphingomonas vulcanisoli]NIJ06849.1 hypothetical protein [Sphingomonas vulcanisoli]
METIYDWVTVAIFAGLIVLFLQRSSSEGEPRDHIWQYLVASVGCAVANYLGNHDDVPYHHALAILVLGGTVAYIWFALKPLERS